jgi:tetratricopeptide (TPR) repeat protein
MLLRSRAIGALALSALAFTACVDSATEHRVKANAFLKGGDAETAVKECELGLASKPHDVPLLIMKGKALFEIDRLDDAKAAYRDALDASGANEDLSLSEAYLGLGKIGSKQKDWPTARANFEILVRLNKDKDAYSHLNVARSCLELHDMDCAIAHGEAAAHLRGGEEGVLYTLGTIYLTAGRLKDAEATFQHICDVVPAASSCPYGVALVAAQASDRPRALAELAEAVKRKVPNPGQIAGDPGFASIKDDPEFVALVVKANAAP